MYPSEPAIDAANSYPSQQTPAPYFTFPSWWRPFIFQVLSTRQLSIYLYLCTLFSETGTAYPLKTQIAEDMGIRNRGVVDEALEHLEVTGFLISEKRSLNRERGRVRRTIYQRPAIEFTLLRLLDKRLINGFLLTPSSEDIKASYKRHRSAIRMGLRKLTGLAGAVYEYDEQTEPAAKAAMLRDLLRCSLRTKSDDFE